MDSQTVLLVKSSSGMLAFGACSKPPLTSCHRCNNVLYIRYVLLEPPGQRLSLTCAPFDRGAQEDETKAEDMDTA